VVVDVLEAVEAAGREDVTAGAEEPRRATGGGSTVAAVTVDDAGAPWSVGAGEVFAGTEGRAVAADGTLGDVVPDRAHPATTRLAPRIQAVRAPRARRCRRRPRGQEGDPVMRSWRSTAAIGFTGSSEPPVCPLDPPLRDRPTRRRGQPGGEEPVLLTDMTGPGVGRSAWSRRPDLTRWSPNGDGLEAGDLAPITTGPAAQSLRRQRRRW
jgi:hypothetical protein